MGQRVFGILSVWIASEHGGHGYVDTVNSERYFVHRNYIRSGDPRPGASAVFSVLPPANGGKYREGCARSPTRRRSESLSIPRTTPSESKRGTGHHKSRGNSRLSRINNEIDPSHFTAIRSTNYLERNPRLPRKPRQGIVQSRNQCRGLPSLSRRPPGISADRIYRQKVTGMARRPPYGSIQFGTSLRCA